MLCDLRSIIMGSVEQKILIKMLNLYKQMRFLWDRNDGDYLNKQKRQKGYEMLLEVYKQYEPDADTTALRKKMENMRSAYNREVKKVLAAKVKGSLHTPRLWYFDALSFLQDTDEIYHYVVDDLNSIDETSRSSTPQSHSKDIFEGISQESHSQSTLRRLLEKDETEEVPISEKKQRLNLVKEDNEYITSAQGLMGEHEWEIIGKAIGIQLRDIEKRQLAIAQKIISDAIFYAKMGKLTEGAYLSL